MKSSSTLQCKTEKYLNFDLKIFENFYLNKFSYFILFFHRTLDISRLMEEISLSRSFSKDFNIKNQDYISENLFKR